MSKNARNNWFKLYNGKTLLMLNETELDLINEALNIMIPVKGINNTDIIDDIVELKVSIKAQREKSGPNHIYEPIPVRLGESHYDNGKE